MWPVIPDPGIGASQADAVFASEPQRRPSPTAPRADAKLTRGNGVAAVISDFPPGRASNLPLYPKLHSWLRQPGPAADRAGKLSEGQDC
jgi:hypothetical protein